MGFYRIWRASCTAMLSLSLLLSNVADADDGQQAPTLIIPRVHVQEQETVVFSAEEMKAFVAAAAKADQIKDPLQRCLHFPDPPGSHWLREGLVAYCRYVLQPTISITEFDNLIESGNARELDRRFSAWEAEPKDHPDAFFHFLLNTFGSADPTRQSLIESWKQQSPKSAYAYALSGWNFMNMGWNARGAKFAADTPQSNFDGMENSMERARGDLEMAIRLDPGMTVPYAAMINIGTAMSDRDYVLQGIDRGLQTSGAKYPVFAQLTKYTASRWHGNPRSQAWLLSEVEKSVSKEPLLHVIRALVLAYASNIDYDVPVDGQWSVYRQVLDDTTTYSLLWSVGRVALNHDQYALAYVCLSEAARFEAADQQVIDERARAASMMGPLENHN